MPKKMKRKIRGKIRQQVKYVIDDTNFWDDDLLIADEMDFKNESKDKVDKPDRPRKKEKLRQPTHRDIEFWLDDEST